MATKLQCEICGGKLNIRIGAGHAECESCGNVSELDPKDTARFRAVFREAERLMLQNTVSGYEEAIQKLQSLPFIDEAREKEAVCKRRLELLRERQRQREEARKRDSAKDTRLGIVILIVSVLFAVAAVAGIACLIVLLIKGMLPPAVTAIVVAAIAAVGVLVILGRIRRGG